MSPWPVALSPFFAAFATPFSFKIRRAFLLSPPASASAFLISITPAPVCSRSVLMSSAEILFLLIWPFLSLHRIRFSLIDCCSRQIRHEAYSLDRVIIGGNGIVHVPHAGVGVHEAHDLDFCGAGFLDRDFVMADIDGKNGLGKLFHILDSL